MSRFLKSVTAFLVLATCSASAFALSPPGTPEYQAEMVAIQKMRQSWGAYSVQSNSVQMRGNRLSIVIPATNRIGRRVDFRALVTRQSRRDGSYFYNVATPQIVQ